MVDQIKWWYPTVQDLANKTLRIDNTGLQPHYFTLITDKVSGQGIRGITKVELVITVKAEVPHITAKVTLREITGEYNPLTREVDVELEYEPELLLDAEVAEIEMRWKANL